MFNNTVRAGRPRGQSRPNLLPEPLPHLPPIGVSPHRGMRFGALGLFGAILGPSWGHLGAILGPLAAILRPRGAILGPSWGLLGSSWCLLASLGTSRRCRSYRKLRGVRHFLLYVLIWFPKAFSEPCWGHFGPSWGPLGPSWGHVEAILGPLGASRAPPDPCQPRQRDAIWGPGASWGHLGASYGYLGVSWGRLGAVLGPSWGLLGPLGAILGPDTDRPEVG